VTFSTGKSKKSIVVRNIRRPLPPLLTQTAHERMPTEPPQSLTHYRQRSPMMLSARTFPTTKN
jgi:hypothetical protein